MFWVFGGVGGFRVYGLVLDFTFEPSVYRACRHLGERLGLVGSSPSGAELQVNPEINKGLPLLLQGFFHHEDMTRNLSSN